VPHETLLKVGEFEDFDFDVAGSPVDPFRTSPPQPLNAMLINPTMIEAPIPVEWHPKRMEFR
jgi:hypothetical protein